MFNKILVAVDDTNDGDKVFERAIALAELTQAKLMIIHALNVVDDTFTDFPVGVDVFSPRLSEASIQRHMEILAAQEEQGLERLKDYAKTGLEKGIAVEFTQVAGDPGSRICALARNWEADLVVLGRRGRKGFSELLMGSVSNYVLHHAPCSVLTVQHIDNADDADAAIATDVAGTETPIAEASR
ncbi:universal stress protein [Vacuolonema iberomarrocanum]|uniref:universal stress protein n=1 Tax=Vacuolonema iberomarrocanum TaxID=3454632 RepID=UPI0019DB3CDC|nr:universal stress protein [filamentous cyanobacterium LEGE 07170]